jgi:hypothetical protein
MLFHSLLILQMPGTHSRRSRTRCTFLYLQQQPNSSLHNNSFRGADIDTGLTVNAHLFIDFRFLIFNRDCRGRALIYTCFASGTFFGVNDCNQLIHSIVCIGPEIKNRFRYKPLKNTIFSSFFGKKGFLSMKNRIIVQVSGNDKKMRNLIDISGISEKINFPN